MTERNRKGRRWKFLLPAALLVLAAGVGWFRWQQTGLSSETLTVSDARLPAAFAGFRISLLSDLHSASFGAGNEKLLAMVEAQRPDLIAVTGDLLDRSRPDYALVEPLFRGLTAIAPTYYVTGNHEWALGSGAVEGLKRTIAACGATVLSNEYLPLEREGERIILMGIDDPNGYRDQKKLPELMSEVRAAYGNPYVLLLAHRNDGMLYESCRVDVTLCGHAHGGLFRLPFTDGLIAVDRSLFPKWTAGVYELEYGQMAVSRGLGNSGLSFRLWNRPDVPLVVLESGKNTPPGGTLSSGRDLF